MFKIIKLLVIHMFALKKWSLKMVTQKYELYLKFDLVFILSGLYL